MGKQWKQCQTLFWGAPKSCMAADGDYSHEIKRCLLLGRRVMINLNSILKSRDITLPTGPSSQSYGFSGRHVDVRLELWRKLSTEELMLLNCGVGEDSWESPGLQGDQTSHPKGNQSWIFIERTDAEAETPILWPPDSKNWLIRKDPDAGKDWRQEENGKTEDEMAEWHHPLDGHEFE